VGAIDSEHSRQDYTRYREAKGRGAAKTPKGSKVNRFDVSVSN